MNDLGTVVLTQADSTLLVETVRPETVELDVALGHVGVSDQEPSTEDSLGKHVQDGVGDDLAINANLARAVGKTPDTDKVSKGIVGGILWTYIG
jgi:hypothetical protein